MPQDSPDPRIALPPSLVGVALLQISLGSSDQSQTQSHTATPPCSGWLADCTQSAMGKCLKAPSSVGLMTLCFQACGIVPLKCGSTLWLGHCREELHQGGANAPAARTKQRERPVAWLRWDWPRGGMDSKSAWWQWLGNLQQSLFTNSVSLSHAASHLCLA